MSSDISHFIAESSADSPGGDPNPDVLWARSNIWPRNSGCQTVVTDLLTAMQDAKSMEARIRPFAIAAVMARKSGATSIGSEQGNQQKLMQTTRTVSTLIGGQNVGPPTSPMDRWLYGKERTKNNPKGRGGDELM